MAHVACQSCDPHDHDHEPAATSAPERRLSWGRYALASSGAALVGGLVVDMFNVASPVAVRILFALSLTSGVPLTFGNASRSIRRGALDINVLMLVAAAGALVLGHWSEAAAVVFLFAVAEALEAVTLDHARGAVRALMSLAPSDALIVDESGGRGERRVPTDQIDPGTIVIVKPGERIPVDGLVIEGASDVNQAPITGESMPVERGVDDDVFAGTVNGRGALRIRATRARKDSTLARILHLVERAQQARAPSQTFVERFAAIYTPAVIVLAAIVALGPPIVFGGSWEAWSYRALVLLVVSCPCALVISTPVSIVAALAAAAKAGVLIKGGRHLERVGRVRCVAFDKTGTLTEGRPAVVSVMPVAGLSSSEVLSIAASVERRSEHPIAQAIAQRAADDGLIVEAGHDVSSLPGRGAEGRVDGRAVVLGNHRLFEERRLCTPAMHERLDQVAADGLTPVLVARAEEAVGVIAIADRPRGSSRAALDRLRREGVESVIMLTGDAQGTAKAVASALGVDEFRADLLPADKVAVVDELRRRYGPVAMVGDGVNDAPALASADVGIAMGVMGSDVALETADMALMTDELSKVPYAFRLSRATLRNIQANLAISLALKAGFVVAAIAGVATLWMAVLADTGASVIVVANALRLLRAD